MDTPKPVNIVGAETTIPVKIVEEDKKTEPKFVNKDDNQSLAPTTTHQQDKTREGQQVVNLMWERTQSIIAIGTVLTNLLLNSIMCIIVIVFKVEITPAQLALITLCLQPISLTTGIVIGFYFSRTNHTKIGGVGPTEGRER